MLKTPLRLQGMEYGIMGKKGMSGRPLIFGEVLFDRFEKEGAVLGGAPFNVAWHLHGFGLNPLLISRIGRDKLGNKVMEGMKDWGMDIKGVQRDPVHPTGVVEVTLHGKEPGFSILPRQGYDFIDSGRMGEVVRQEEISLLYHGTLAARHSVSREALNSLMEASMPRFVDINLREPWWQKDMVAHILKGARWVKMNRDELYTMGGNGPGEDREAAARLLREYGFAMLMVTMGSGGALLIVGEASFCDKRVPVREVVDTVGAGDAFSAVCIMGLIRNWGPSLILERALEFASRIVGQRGATAHDPHLYKMLRERWKG